MEFAIQHTWDSDPVSHDPIKIAFSPGQGGLKMEVSGPFFNDPAAPPGPPGHAFPGLHKTANTLGDNLKKQNKKKVSTNSKKSNFSLQQQLPIVFSATVTGDRWKGEALLPWTYFPPNVNKMNSYAIHGSGEERTYEALYPIPKADIVEGQKPNFHRLEYFQNFSLQSIMGEGWVQPDSDLWKGKH
uniref:Chromosome 4 open reading frame 33 n=1 Tax=Cynoglossus semilaevis TaxID=244447 RepID=A0A3P8VXS4_CYNSE